MAGVSQEAMSHTQEYEKTFDDIFGESDDDEEVVMPQKATKKAQSSAVEADDIFADSDEEEAKPSRKRVLGGSDSKKRKKKGAKEEKKKKRKKQYDDGEGIEDGDGGGKSRSKREKRDKGEEGGLPEENVGEDPGAYDSEPEVERTAEDDAFIDANDDDADLVNDYNAQTQNFDDGKGNRGRDPTMVDGKKYKDEFTATMAGMRKKKAKQLTDTQIESAVGSIIEKMRKAHVDDESSLQAGEVALAKVTLLPVVEKTVGMRPLQNMLLERNILEVFKSWIEPRADKSLASLSVRSAVYKILLNLPCQIDHLKRCGIGKTVFGLRKHKQETLENKRLLRELIERWSRPIFANPNDLRQDTQALILEAYRQRKTTAPVEVSAPVNVSFDPSKAKQKDSGASRVAVPHGEGYMFTVQPDSKVDKSTAREIKTSTTKTELFKRMQLNKKGNRRDGAGGHIQQMELSGRNKK